MIQTSLARYAHQCIVTKVSALRVTSHFLIGLYVPQEETHAWYYKSNQESMAGELIDTRDEPTTMLLNKEDSIKLLSRDTHLYQQISAAISPHQRIVFVQ